MTGTIVFSCISIFLVVAYIVGIYRISKLVDSCNQKINFVTDWNMELIEKTDSLIDTTEELLREINSMTANGYQKAALRTANKRLSPKSQLQNGIMGLCSESGEALDILKKHLYQGHELDIEHIVKELGDVAWYLAISAAALGYELDEIFEKNIEKLQNRYPEKFDSKLSINRKEGDI